MWDLFLTNKFYEPLWTSDKDDASDQSKSVNYRLRSKNTLNLDHSTLLDRQLSYVLPCYFGAYTLLQFLMGMDWAYSANPICNAEVAIISSWQLYAPCSGAAVLAVFCIMQLIRIWKLLAAEGVHGNYSLFKLHLLLLSMLLISASSMGLDFFLRYGGLCKDALG